MELGPHASFPHPLLAFTPTPVRAAKSHGACLDDRGILFTLAGLDANYATLSAHHAVGGELVSVQNICLELGRFAELIGPVPMVARRGQVLIGWGDEVIRVNANGRVTREQLPDR